METETPQPTHLPDRLPGAAHEVLVFTEHVPSAGELERVVAELSRHPDVRVTVVLHHDPVAPGERVYEHGGVTHDQLERLLETLRLAGFYARGDVVSGDVEHALLTEVRVRRADAVVLLAGRHLLAHLAHRDLEHRLRHHAAVPVLSIVGRAAPHLV